MIVLGFILLICGYWLLPLLPPPVTPPAIIDTLVVGAGWVLIIVGVILFLLSFTGRTFGGRKYWY